MDKKILLVVLAATITVCQGQDVSNYDISRNRLGAGGNYGYPGHYPGNNYPQGPGYPGGAGYPGSHYPGPAGPPGAHPGCPLCDSSVYSYCSYKQAHDSCCCESPGYQPFHCRKSDCRSLYANSCDEYHLITNCCCVDVQKSAVAAAVVPPIVAPVVIA
ncbi:uncharacterized protein LOC115453409 isoform X2 [Manduca sexta]|uniref:Cuticle protein n=1 Tax=Manduca sexta TaxID=7130 RepID=A0A922CD53_MANSE|nr:uncharacterized protein LOC115453409 isoform X2 [Manduca sexta]KAG6442535.1 hypothetical protein O3G_MSEX002399 [Manduca sexta]